MRLRVLGCSGGVGQGRLTTSFLIDDDILIDAGSGLGELSLDEMAKIRHIFLTHSHLDHISFLPLLVDSIFERIKEPIIIYGQPATLKGLREHIFNWTIWPDFSELPHPQQPVMRYEEVLPGSVCRIEGRQLELIPVNHIVPTVGYRVESVSGKAFAFSGDTTSNSSFWQALNAHKGLDLLLMEVAFSNSEEELSRIARHYCSSSLATDLVKLKHSPEIYLTHQKPGEEQTIFRECKAAIQDREIKQLKNNLIFQL